MDDKGKGIIAYIFGWLGGLIVLLAFKDNNKKTTIHAAQAIVIGGGVFIINVIYRMIPITIPFFSTVLWALQLVLVIMGIVKVCNNDAPELPVVGNIAKSIFAKKIEEAPEVAPKAEEAKKATEAKEEPKQPEEPKDQN